MQVDAEFGRPDIDRPGGLDRVRVDHHLRVFCPRDPAHVGYGLDRANLVVRRHDADDYRFGPDRRLERREIDHSFAVDREKCGAETFLLELFDRVEDGVVLDLRRDDVVPASACTLRQSRSSDGHVV